MAESNSAVMRIALLNEDMTIESSHFRNSENTDTTEGTCLNIENFTFSDIGTQNSLAVALEAIEGDVARRDIAVKGAAGKGRL